MSKTYLMHFIHKEVVGQSKIVLLKQVQCAGWHKNTSYNLFTPILCGFFLGVQAGFWSKKFSPFFALH